MKYASTESPCCWESGEKQFIKWAAEGAVKCICKVFCNVWYMSDAGNMLVFRKVRSSCCESRWHHG